VDQTVDADIVMSWNCILVILFTNVPIALNWTGLGTPVGAVVATQVVVAAGRGVTVGVTVGLGVLLAVEVGKNVGVGAGPSAIVMESRAKPGLGVGVAEVPLPPPQLLSTIAPNNNKPTGATTSHLSHRENIKS
jgi:hypothetical protein